MATQPLVSILIPAYNAEKWLKQTLDSAVNQNCPKKEIIVVDDGSKDGTYEIAKAYRSQDVKIIRQPNAGACAARNTALKHAQGDYIQWLDADDLLHPDKISLQLQRIREDNDEEVLYSSAFGTFYYRWQKARFTPNSLWRDLSPAEWFFHKFNNDDSLFPAVWLVSRKLTDRVGAWDERLTLDDDGEYFGRTIAASKSVNFVPGGKSFYRQVNSSSISKTVNHSTCQSLLLSYKLCIRYFLTLDNSARSKAAVVKYLQTNLIYFYPEEVEILKELEQIVSSLGGKLLCPEFSPKYKLITRILGVKSAKGVASVVRGLKQTVLKTNDLVLSYITPSR
jgi:glycosyltransferase involved in cell wall biosynthesis